MFHRLRVSVLLSLFYSCFFADAFYVLLGLLATDATDRAKAADVVAAIFLTAVSFFFNLLYS